MTDSAMPDRPDDASTIPVNPASSLLATLRPVLERRRIVLGVGLVCALASAAWSLSRPRSWTSSASFMPESPRASNSLSAIAVQFGVNVGADAGQSLQFYTDLLTSREILWQVAMTRYNVADASPPRTGDLISLLEIRAPTEPLRREALLKRLRTNIRATNSPKSGVVSLTVSAPWPSLAEAMAARLIDALGDFNLEKRQSRAGAERKFIEGRLASAKSDLSVSQDRLRDFMQGNRATVGSPRLALEQNRLEQQVNLAQARATALNSAFEQARLEEVRNTPVITTLEDADYPARPDSRGGLKNTILGGLLGVILSAIILVALDKYRTFVGKHEIDGTNKAPGSSNHASGHA